MRPKVFVIVGPNQDKSGLWGGYRFINGACPVPNSEFEAARHMLGRYYSAFPSDEIEVLPNGQYVRKGMAPPSGPSEEAKGNTEPDNSEDFNAGPVGVDGDVPKGDAPPAADLSAKVIRKGRN